MLSRIFYPAAPKLSRAGCLFVSVLWSCFLLLCGVNPPTVVLPSEPEKHGPAATVAQARWRLRFPLGLTEVFAVSHIVGIQHQPVYWSPCGFSLPLSPSPLPFLFFFLSCLEYTFLHGIHTQNSYQIMRQNTTKLLTELILLFVKVFNHITQF